MGKVTQNQWTEQQTNDHGQQSKRETNRQEDSLSSIQQSHALSFNSLVVLVLVVVVVPIVVVVVPIVVSVIVVSKTIAVISMRIIVLLNILTSSNPVITVVRSSLEILIRRPVSTGRGIVVVIIIVLPWVPTSTGTLLVVLGVATAAARITSAVSTSVIITLGCIIYCIVRLCCIVPSVIALDSVIALGVVALAGCIIPCHGIVNKSGGIIVGGIAIGGIVVASTGISIIIVVVFVVGVIILVITQPSLLARYPSHVVWTATHKRRPFNDRT